jgi:hypothetical protein
MTSQLRARPGTCQGAADGPVFEAVRPTARDDAYLKATDDVGYPAARQLREVLAAVRRAFRPAGTVRWVC